VAMTFFQVLGFTIDENKIIVNITNLLKKVLYMIMTKINKEEHVPW
jgi:hypothetical protein